MSTRLIAVHHDFSIRPLENLDAMLSCERPRATAMSILRHPGVPPKMFLAGPAGSGKSTLINEICKLAACSSSNGDRACNTCDGCRDFRTWGLKRSTSIHADIEAGDRRTLHYLPLYCRNQTRATIHQEVEALRDRHKGLRIIHLEEAASLNRDRCDESITDLMDDPDFATCRWFATAVSDAGLDGQFRRRCNVKFTTSRPSDSSLARHLAQHCRRLGIAIDHPKTWTLLAKRSWGIVGLATSILPMALMNTPPSLEQFLFDSGG